mmetsp:Transcript_53141/g.168718  ORF Transcript_53141/g.168718 Transcript_53141/m.168718 type:complete len:265 (+) Transcript_53141:389-1183(+)
MLRVREWLLSLSWSVQRISHGSRFWRVRGGWNSRSKSRVMPTPVELTIVDVFTCRQVKKGGSLGSAAGHMTRPCCCSIRSGARPITSFSALILPRACTYSRPPCAAASGRWYVVAGITPEMLYRGLSCRPGVLTLSGKWRLRSRIFPVLLVTRTVDRTVITLVRVLRATSTTAGVPESCIALLMTWTYLPTLSTITSRSTVKAPANCMRMVCALTRCWELGSVTRVKCGWHCSAPLSPWLSVKVLEVPSAEDQYERRAPDWLLM